MARIKSTEESGEIDLSDLIYRANIFILENDTFGNLQASYRSIAFMDRILSHLRDKQYYTDMDHIAQTFKLHPGKTQAETAAIQERKLKQMMDMKHECLMGLAFRNGKLGHKKTRSMTGYKSTDEENEQII